MPNDKQIELYKQNVCLEEKIITQDAMVIGFAYPIPHMTQGPT